MKEGQRSTIKYFVVLTLAIGLFIFGFAYLIKESFISNSSQSSILGATEDDINLEKADLVTKTNRKWILKDLDSNSEYTNLVYTLDIQKDLAIDVEAEFTILGTEKRGKMEETEEGKFETSVSVYDLSPGKYEIQSIVSINDQEFKSVKREFNVSYPMYVIWTMDWEGADTSDNELANLSNFSEKYNVPVSHLFNPRIYVSDQVSKTRALELTEWIKSRETKGDDIGLHLHMHNDLVNAAGLEVKDDPKWTNHIQDGHDVPCSAYSYDEFKKILEWSKDQFTSHGLKEPVYFRAGGWFADMENLKALNDSGFLLDTSGREYYLWGEKTLEGHWNLDVKTQPYKISLSDQNNSSNNNMNLWEFPNNGGDSLYYSSSELITRFDENYNKDLLDDVVVFTLLSHPHNITSDIQVLEPLYQHMDQYNIQKDSGPLIYTTLLHAYNDIVQE